MFKAKDIMSRELLTVTKGTPIFDAIKILVDHGVTGLPVVDSVGYLQGIVTEKDLLQFLYNPTFSHSVVSEVMTHPVVSFKEDDNLLYVCECLIKNNFRRVPILSSEGKLSGIISRRDSIKFILVRKDDDKIF